MSRLSSTKNSDVQSIVISWGIDVKRFLTSKDIRF